MHILAIKVSGFCFLKDNFEIDLRAIARSNQVDYKDEVANLTQSLNIFRTYAFVGANASGKTTVLNLIRLCSHILCLGRAAYSKSYFRGNIINLCVVFESNKKIYKYEGELRKDRAQFSDSYVSFCSFVDEKLSLKNNDIVNNNIFSDFDTIVASRNNLKNSIISSNFSIMGKFNCRDSVGGSFITSSSIAYPEVYTIFLSRFFKFSLYLKKSILRLLDDSIEDISYANKNYILKRKRMAPQILSTSELFSVLSSGTLRGIITFTASILAIKAGGILLIDEIENGFHKSLINDIIFLFNDARVNRRNATLFFSTHHSELLDALRRRDNVFICHRNGTQIDIKNMYLYGYRRELMKSRLFNTNAFNNLADYEALLDVREAIYETVNNR